MKQISSFLLTLLALTALCAPTFAEPSRKDKEKIISGTVEVDLAEQKKKKVDPYVSAQDNTIAFYQKLLKHAESLAKGGKEKVSFLASPEVLHLNGLYLYCSIQNGTCPEILDSILEIDVINSKLSGKVSCSSLLTFWRSWKNNKLEKRHKHHVKIGFMKQTSNFKREILPRYYRCSRTVSDELAKGESLSTQEFFAQRYSDDELYKEAIEQTLEKLVAMKKSIPNVFVETE